MKVAYQKFTTHFKIRVKIFLGCSCDYSFKDRNCKFCFYGMDTHDIISDWYDIVFDQKIFFDLHNLTQIKDRNFAFNIVVEYIVICVYYKFPAKKTKRICLATTFISKMFVSYLFNYFEKLSNHLSGIHFPIKVILSTKYLVHSIYLLIMQFCIWYLVYTCSCMHSHAYNLYG